MELKRTGLGFLLIPPSTIPLNRSLMHPIKFPLRVLRLFTLVSRLGFSHPYTRIHVEQVGGQAVLGRQSAYATPWLTERHGYDPTSFYYPSEQVSNAPHKVSFKGS